MEHTLPPPETEKQVCSAPPQTTGTVGASTDIVDQEESSFTESQKGSPEWTNEKHSLYLKSMEASFVDQLYNSLDTRNWKIENDCSSDSTSSWRIHVNDRCPSGQYQVLQNGLWSRNPWIRHFRSGNEHGATEEKPSLTSFSNTEVIDQNFVEEETRVEITNTACSKKRKSTYAAPKLGSDQAATSFGHISYNRNH